MDNLRNAKTELHFVAERQWTKKGGDRVHGSRSTPISGVRDRSQKMMLDGHYDVWGYMPSFQQTGNQRPLVGIEIGTKGQAMATAAELKFAFQELGINAKMAHQGNNNYEDDRVVVYVGIKP